MTGPTATILVVDDIPANQSVLERMLTRKGHAVITAEHGQAALEVLRAQPIDLVLLDIMMPVMNGYEVLEHISVDSELSRVPVVVISAVDDSASVVRCIELGAVDYLFKPFNPVLLNARVKACLVQKRIYDQEQAAYAALEAANQAKSEFVSVVSHELKNPIAGIRGYADTLLLGVLGPLNAGQSETLQAIRALTDVMNALLGDLADIAQIEAGYLRLEPAPIALSAALEAVLHSLRSRIQAKAQQVIIDLPSDLPLVCADELRLMQILSNLMSNASKYTPTDGQITVSARQREAQAVEITVRDTGIGMSMDDQRRVFEKFFRASDEQVRQESGTGLGLNITRYLIELHGGCIWFESELGAGTTFCFTIPTVQPEYLPAPAESAAHRNPCLPG